MNDPATPQPSPASLLAAVLRVVWPDRKWKPEWTYRGGVVKEVQLYKAYSKDDLARVVAMLDSDTTRKFDRALKSLLSGEPGHVPVMNPMPSTALKATPAQILAALVAATGAEA